MKRLYDVLARRTFESTKIARYYGKLDFLFKPEEVILEELKEQLKDMKMLDIGVGGGRTTVFFARHVKEYIGIDYSEEMVKVCKERFPELRDNFLVCDARDLKPFQSNSFDFVLFSFNSIDTLCHEDRLKALSEIRRVCKEGGYFCFSFHNLLAIDRLLKIKPTNNPVKLVKRKVKSSLIRFLNQDFDKLKKQDFAHIIDGEHRFTLRVYYVRPSEQIRQLREIGFKNIRAFTWEKGMELKDLSQVDGLRDLFIYFLCS